MRNGIKKFLVVTVLLVFGLARSSYALFETDSIGTRTFAAGAAVGLLGIGAMALANFLSDSTPSSAEKRPYLYVGGDFNTVGGAAIQKIARWDILNSTWSKLGDGTCDYAIYDIVSGNDSTVYAGGFFTNIDGVAANRIAKWDGSTWSPLGDITSTTNISSVLNIAFVDDDHIYVTGNSSADFVAKWDGTTWSPLSGSDGTVYTLTAIEDDLYVGGGFNTLDSGNVASKGIAKWEEGSGWSAVSGLDHSSQVRVYATVAGSDGIYVGGRFDNAGGASACNIAKWDGSMWSPLCNITTCGTTDGSVYAITVGNDGTVYAGGSFTNIDGVSANRIAKWNGLIWSPLDDGSSNGVGSTVYALAIAGDDLYVGGFFTTLTGSGTTVNRVAKWDITTSTWSPLDNGTSVGVGDTVRSLLFVEQ